MPRPDFRDRANFAESEEQKNKVPKVYTLIESGASTEILAQQIYEDFYQQNPEAVLLGLQELQARGDEGRAALNFLKSSTDKLGELAKTLADKFDMSQDELEKLLGIKRFGEIVTATDFFEEVKIAYNHAKRQNLLSPGVTLEDCLIREEIIENIPGPGHIMGYIDAQFTNQSSVFSAGEPTYLELLGPKEILRLRSLPEGRFLLLGSYGSYSAKDIKQYAEKLNSKIDVNVIDIDKLSVGLIKGDPRSPKNVVRGDALELPYKTESMDHVYTNYLFHFLGRANKDGIERDISRLFQEAKRVLKKGGSLVLIESAYRDKEIAREHLVAQKEIASIASKTGFVLSKDFPKGSIWYSLLAENSSAKIDENGFPHYEHTLINSSPRLDIARRYIKK